MRLWMRSNTLLQWEMYVCMFSESVPVDMNIKRWASFSVLGLIAPSKPCCRFQYLLIDHFVDSIKKSTSTQSLNFDML